LVCDEVIDECVRPGTRDVDAAVSIDASLGDTDSDGVADNVDNCRTVANPGQYDEDLDSVGDACDNCPADVNPEQLNELELETNDEPDGLGDACDPYPTTGGDTIAFFDGFNESLDEAAWSVVRGSNDWSTDDGAVVQSNTSVGFRGLAWTGPLLENAVIITKVRALELPNSEGPQDSIRSVGVLGQYDDEGSGQGRGYACTHFYDPNNPAESTLLSLIALQISPVLVETLPADRLVINDPIRFSFEVSGTARTQRCQSVEDSNGNRREVVADDPNFTNGLVGLRTHSSSAAFDYVLIIERAKSTKNARNER